MKATIYNASAGSGKTYRLAYKYIHDVVEEPLLYRNILAVTFTNKATEEMKRRILSQLNTLARGAKSDYMEALKADLGLSEETIRYRAKSAQTLILHDYSRFTVLTIDKFFQRVLRAFIQEIGIDIDYNLEIDSAPIVAQGADALIEQITVDESLRKWLMELVQERIEEGRKWNVRDAILALRDELFKEQARLTLESSLNKEELQQIIGEMEQRARKIVAEIRAMAQEALKIVDDEGVSLDSFAGKSRSLPYVFRKIALSEGMQLPEITEAQRRNCDDLAKWVGKDIRLNGVAIRLQGLLRAIIDRYNSDLKHVNTSQLLRENYRSFALMYDLYDKTQEICREQNTMLLSQTSRILAEFVRDSDAPFIYEKVGSRYSHFMIDEFQDTSRREWNNFLPLLRETLALSEPDESRILIVGDIKQSIYRWRGGDWRILQSDVERELGEESAEVVHMVDNYRSRPTIVRFNNDIIEGIVARENIVLNEELAVALDHEAIDRECHDDLRGMVLRAYESHAQNPKSQEGGVVEVSTYEEEPPTIERICEAIDRGYKPSDIMILTRTNSEASRVAQQLLEFKHQNHDPKYRFDVMTQEALVVGYAPVSQFLIATLHLALNPNDALQHAIFNTFLERAYVDEEFTAEDLEFLQSIRMFSPLEAIESIVMHYPSTTDDANIAYTQAIHEQIITYSKSRIGDTSLFLEWWHEKGTMQSLRVERSDEAIEILTIHKAKGLEKEVVIIPYCNWDYNPKTSSGVNKNFVWSSNGDMSFPIEYKKSMAESAFAADYLREKVYTRIDSINTLYVALTRAVESLHILIKSTTTKAGELSAKGVGKLVLDSIPEGAHLDGTRYIYGEFTPAEPKQSARRVPLHIMQSYESSPTDLRLRLPTKRYHEDSEGEFAPREVGILMHRVFEQSRSLSEIHTRVEMMLSNGEINPTEHSELLSAIDDSLLDPRVKEWFEGEWDRVRNESQIILPKGDIARRPDRVMTRGARAVVVDYKFGSLHPASHIKQMRRYMELLRQMGYADVEGYLWYIRRREIVEV